MSDINRHGDSLAEEIEHLILGLLTMRVVYQLVADWRFANGFAGIVGALVFVMFHYSGAALKLVLPQKNRDASAEQNVRSVESSSKRLENSHPQAPPPTDRLANEIDQLRSVIAEFSYAIKGLTAALPPAIPCSGAERDAKGPNAGAGTELTPFGGANRQPNVLSSGELLASLKDLCLMTSLARAAFAARLPADWGYDVVGNDSELPDAYVVGELSSANRWLIPNTRAWLPFRALKLFDVSGRDVPGARIRNVTKLPIVSATSTFNVIERGVIEVTA